MENKNKLQQRELIIREFENEIEFDGTAWKMSVPKSECVEFFAAWLRGDLKENSHFDNRTPRLIKELEGGE